MDDPFTTEKYTAKSRQAISDKRLQGALAGVQGRLGPATRKMYASQPEGDAAYANAEFIFSDLCIAESRIERLGRQLRKTPNDEDRRELAALQRCREWLEQDRPFGKWRPRPTRRSGCGGSSSFPANPSST